MPRFTAPNGQSSYIDIDGVVHKPDAAGVFDLPQSEGARALGAGFAAAPVTTTTDTAATATDTAATATTEAGTKKDKS